MSRVPSLSDLGVYIPTGPSGTLKRPLSDDQLADLNRSSRVADNGLLTIHHGIAAIGHVLATIGENDRSESTINSDYLTNEVLSDLGWLLEGLGELAYTMTSAQSNIEYVLKEHGAITGEMPK